MHLCLGIHLLHAGALLKGLNLVGLGLEGAEVQRHSVRNVLSVAVALVAAQGLARYVPGTAGPALVLLLLAAAWWQASA